MLACVQPGPIDAARSSTRIRTLVAALRERQSGSLAPSGRRSTRKERLRHLCAGPPWNGIVDTSYRPARQSAREGIACTLVAVAGTV